VTAYACPLCGSALQKVIDGMVGEEYADLNRNSPRAIRMVMRPAPFYACTGCEWCAEIPSKLDLRSQLERSLEVRS